MSLFRIYPIFVRHPDVTKPSENEVIAVVRLEMILYKISIIVSIFTDAKIIIHLLGIIRGFKFELFSFLINFEMLLIYLL